MSNGWRCSLRYCDALEVEPGLAAHRAAAWRHLEERVDTLVGVTGAMERIKSTPLPIVYITHLRSTLVLYLLFMPVVFEALWSWGTIPAVALIAFVLLGVEGAATECETPFRPGRINHLRMGAYCNFLVQNVQLLLEAASEHEGLAAGLAAAQQQQMRHRSCARFARLCLLQMQVTALLRMCARSVRSC